MSNMPTKIQPPNNKMNPAMPTTPRPSSSINDDEDDDLVLFKLSGAKAKIYHKEILAENLNSEGVINKRCSAYSDNGVNSDEYSYHNRNRNNSLRSISGHCVKLKRASSDDSGRSRRIEFYSEKPLINSNIIVNPIESYDDENLPLVTTQPGNLINVKKRDISLVFTKTSDPNLAYTKVNRRVKKSVLNGIKIEDERIKRRSLPGPIDESHLEDSEQKRRLLRHSWYPGYDILEEDFEQDCSDNKEAFTHNLAGAKSQNPSNGEYESASLLDQNVVVNSNRGRRIGCGPTSAIQQTIPEGPPVNSLGGPVSRKRRFEQFLKNLVGRRPSIQSSLLSSPELKIDKSPSEHNILQLSKASRLANSTTSLTSVHQKLWSVVPLLKKDVSCNSLAAPITKSQPLDNDIVKLRKCETVLALTHSSSHSIEPIKPLNRLRNCASVATCSRCSSLLSLAAAGSRYSLNVSGGQFVPVNKSFSFGNDQSIYRIRSSISSSSSSGNVSPTPSAGSSSSRQAVNIPLIASSVAVVKHTCKLCLGEYSSDNFTRIAQCGCLFCTECMTAYVEFEISEGAYEVSCPDALCPAQGIITMAEIMTLAAASLVEKHNRYRLNREVELDKHRTWCPKAGCETICMVGQTPSSSDKIVQFQPSSSMLPSPCAVHCPTCEEDFCSGCKKTWHPELSCEENTKKLAADGNSESLGIPFDNDLIKCCPMCAVPIEKDEGCAQMMCKRCKHVFCWYCLASLDDDFLLRHYDKGPCKNKLGHSRASVVWHRAQVIGIFAGFGILLLVASPLLLLAAPCIVCCKCRICSNAAKLEETEGEYDDAIIGLQR